MDSRKLDGLALAGLVHDLNNVFETIEEAAELISEDEQWTDVAAAVSRSVDRGRRLVGSLAGQARPGCNLAEVAGNAAGFLNDVVNLLHLPDTQVVLSIPDSLRVSGAASDWERVFMNLFLNAAQAMKDGGEITVEAANTGRHISIKVSDNGSGIPEEHLHAIFEPHFSTRVGGGGLGLHIVASLVREHGGSVHASNRPDANGACFRIEVPAAAA